jgi:hypothetical protein
MGHIALYMGHIAQYMRQKAQYMGHIAQYMGNIAQCMGHIAQCMGHITQYRGMSLELNDADLWWTQRTKAQSINFSVSSLKKLRKIYIAFLFPLLCFFIFISLHPLNFYRLYRSIDFIFTFRILLSTLWPIFWSCINSTHSDLYVMQAATYVDFRNASLNSRR